MAHLLQRIPVSMLLALALVACSTRPPIVPATNLPSSPLASSLGDTLSITGFDVFADRQRLHATVTARHRSTQHASIGYLFSDDGGQHWSPPHWLDASLINGLESKAGNDAQVAASGDRILLVWQSSGELPGMGPLAVAASNDGGQHWQTGSNPTASNIDQSHPDLSRDASGRFHLVWLDDREENGYQGLRYAQTADGTHWMAQQTLDDSTCSCCWNRLLVSDDEQLTVLYRDGQPRDMAIVRSNDGGQHWPIKTPVGRFNWQFDGCPHNGGALAQDSSGHWQALVWTGASEQAGLYHLQSPADAQQWSSPQPVAAHSGAFHADIAAHDDGRWAMVWDALGPTGSAVLFAESVDNGRHWSSARQLSNATTHASQPRLIATPDGWLALWLEQVSRHQQHWQSVRIP